MFQLIRSYAVTQRHGWAVPSATASGARPKPMLQNGTPCGPTSRSAGDNATKEERDRIRAWGRSSVQRSVRIDTRNGDRLGSGGYDDHDAPGYLLKGGGPLTPEERSELRLLGVRSHGAAHAPKRALTTGWLGSKSRLCACNSP